MKLASIEKVKSVVKHPGADMLSICTVLGYQVITKLNQFSEGQLVVLIQPDTILPDVPWAAFYRAKSNRVKAIKLRKVWSLGIVESLSILPAGNYEEGQEVSEILKITHWEPPIPQNLDAKGVLPFGLPITDEERYQNLLNIPYGEVVDVTLKIDGSNLNCYYKNFEGTISTGVTSRTQDLKLDSVNNYTTIVKKLGILEKLSKFCSENKVNLCLRFEMFGAGIQGSKVNPHSKLPLGLALFSVWNFDTHQYEGPESPFYYEKLGKFFDIPTVPMLEKGVVLTTELIQKYDSGLEKINGQFYEGCVVKLLGGRSFKILSKVFDSQK